MTETWFVTKKIIAALALPPTSLLLLAIAGMLLSRHWPRTGKSVLWIALLSLLGLSTPFVADALDHFISVAPSTPQQQNTAQAIVILGGGREQHPEVGEVPTQQSYERLRYGALLARNTQLPLLLSGGSVYDGAAEAQVMARVLREQFHIEPRWIEDRSRNTHENALRSAEIFKRAGIQTVLLVTHDVHERRALAEFRAAGITAIPMAVSSSNGQQALSERLPNVGALKRSANAIHEILGALFATP